MKQIDFLATQVNYFDHIAPVWDALPLEARGTFWVTDYLQDYAWAHMQHSLYLFAYDSTSDSPVLPPIYGKHPILVAAYGDLIFAKKTSPERPVLYMEHGIGHTFGKAAHPNGRGKRDLVSLFLAPNEYTAKKIREVRKTPIEVIGTPKMDKWFTDYLRTSTRNDPPVIAIGFHHGHKNTPVPESGSAFEHYVDILPSLTEKFKLLAYAHPLAEKHQRPIYEALGIPFTTDFFRVMKMADICINDLSSALYEFLVTGKPVIVLNAPWFRRDVQHGIRFWDYSDIGINVEDPKELSVAIDLTLRKPYFHAEEREKALRDLYPYLGQASRRAANVIVQYLEEK